MSRSIYVAASGIISFFFMTEYYTLVYMSHLFFIHSSFDGHLGCFHVSVVVKVLHRTSGCLYLCKLWFPLDVCPGEVLLGHMVALFLVFKNLLTVLHAGCSSLHSHQQFRRVLFSPHPFQPLLFVHFLIMIGLV